MSYPPEQLLERARRGGAEVAEVYVSETRSQPVSFEANDLKQIELTESQGIALRLWKDGRPGLVVAYGAVEPQELVDRALAISELSDPQESYLTNAIAADYPQRYGQDVDGKHLLTWAETAIEQVLEAYPEVLCEAQWDCSSETVRLLNTIGLDCTYTDSTVDAFLGAELIRGDDFLEVWYSQTDRDRLPPDRLVPQVLQQLDWATHNAVAPTGTFPVLLTPKAADLLWGAIAAAMSGRQVEQNASPWLDKRGKAVLAPAFTLSQQPHMGSFGLPFDDEGTLTQPFTWIDQGILQSFYSDRRIASKLDLPLLGNGFRDGLGGYPLPGLFNLLIAPGQGTLPDLIRSLDTGLIVERVMGEEAGLSGDFSVNVELGYWVQQGEVVGRVKDTMLSGNAYQVLNQLTHLGGDNEWQGSIYLPSMIVEGCFVTSRA